jgi:hypothetical protein
MKTNTDCEFLGCHNSNMIRSLKYDNYAAFVVTLSTSFYYARRFILDDQSNINFPPLGINVVIVGFLIFLVQRITQK